MRVPHEIRRFQGPHRRGWGWSASQPRSQQGARSSWVRCGAVGSKQTTQPFMQIHLVFAERPKGPPVACGKSKEYSSLRSLPSWWTAGPTVQTVCSGPAWWPGCIWGPPALSFPCLGQDPRRQVEGKRTGLGMPCLPRPGWPSPRPTPQLDFCTSLPAPSRTHKPRRAPLVPGSPRPAEQ